MPKVGLPLAAQPLWLPTENLAAGPWEPVCAPVRLATTAASVSFASIPAQYVMFRLRYEIIRDGTTSSYNFRFNNDSGANYSYEYLMGDNATVSSGRVTGATSINTSYFAVEASGHASGELVIAKPIAGAAGLVVGGRAAVQTNIRVDSLVGIWSNTADLINRIDITSNVDNLAAGSIFILEGSKF